MVTSFVTMSGLQTGGSVALAGQKAKDSARDFAWKANADGSLAKVGLIMRQLAPGEVRRLRDLYPDYRFLANVRDPYARAVSNYFSKINRYCKHFDRTSYLRGKVGHLLKGPKTWSDGRVANGFMQDRISFAQMLAGLQRHGVDFDAHFAQQSDLLQLDHIRYDRFLRLEALDTEFRTAMTDLGLPPDMLSRLGSIPRRNFSAYRGTEADLLTDATKAAIRALYPDDFAKLDYPA